MLFNQFHDLAAGSGIGVIYKDAQKDYDVVRWSTNEIESEALARPWQERHRHDTAQAIPVIVYNPLGWVRSGYVTRQVQIPRSGSPGDIWAKTSGQVTSGARTI